MGVEFPPFLVGKEVGVVVCFRVERRLVQDRREMGAKEIHSFLYSP